MDTRQTILSVKEAQSLKGVCFVYDTTFISGKLIHFTKLVLTILQNRITPEKHVVDQTTKSGNDG